MNCHLRDLGTIFFLKKGRNIAWYSNIVASMATTASGVYVLHFRADFRLEAHLSTVCPQGHKGMRLFPADFRRCFCFRGNKVWVDESQRDRADSLKQQRAGLGNPTGTCLLSCISIAYCTGMDAEVSCCIYPSSATDVKAISRLVAAGFRP